MIEEKELRQLVENKETVWNIAKKLGCSKNTVKKYIKEYSIATFKGFYKIEGKKAGRPKGIPMTEEQRLLRSERFRGTGNPFYGRTHSEETRQKMRQNHADFSGKNNPFLKNWLSSEEFRDNHKNRCKKRWEGKDYTYRKAFGKKIQAGYGDISGTFWARVKSNAKARGIPVGITTEQAWEKFQAQGGKCALSGLPLCFEVTLGETTASLDRINSSLGYTNENIQWTHKVINLMKWKLSQEEFVHYCRKVVENERSV